MIGPSTKICGLVGGSKQVSASLSPAIQNSAFAATGLDWVYLPFPVDQASLPQAVEGLAALGAAGVNVTMPHKVEVVSSVTELTDEAAASGAVNTIKFDGARVIGHNTDGLGLLRFLEEGGFDPRGKKVLLLGAGGAARAAVAALAGAGAREIVVATRNPGRAAVLQKVATGAAFAVHQLDRLPGSVLGNRDLVLNATPVGAAGEPPPVDVGLLPAQGFILDMVYAHWDTELVREARNRGLTAMSGVGMLVHQAALSFHFWTGVEAPIPVMMEAVEALKQSEVDAEKKIGL